VSWYATTANSWRSSNSPQRANTPRSARRTGSRQWRRSSRLGTIARALPPHNPGKTFYADNWEDATNFQPDTYLDITPVCEKWLEACDLYPMWRGQAGFFRYNGCYRSLAVMRGCLSGFKYAVALMTDPNQLLYKVRSL
jgi:hypothetical protein